MSSQRKARDRSDRPAAAWLLLVLLFLAYNLSMLDRILIGLLAEPIKQALRVSDTAVSLLQGIAFLLFYSVIGLPIGLLVDRVNRTRLVAAGLAVWSAMTAVCGLVGSYAGLFVGRAGVGIGEATLSPAAFSLIASSFPKSRLALPLGIYSLGGATGAGVALMVGGFLYSRFLHLGPISVLGLTVIQPWQATFLAAGGPGLLLAWLFLRLGEPPRATVRSEDLQSGRWRALTSFYRRQVRLLLPHHLGAAFSSMTALGVTMWVGSFFSRVHGWPIAKTGAIAGAATLAAGVLGLGLAGLVSDRLSESGRLSPLAQCALAAPLGMLAAWVYAHSPNPAVAVAMLCVLLACSMLQFNIANSAYQAMLPEPIRGLASAVLLLFTGLISSLGPTCVALLTEHGFRGPAAMSHALAAFGVLCFAASGVCFMLARRSYTRPTAERLLAPATAQLPDGGCAAARQRSIV